MSSVVTPDLQDRVQTISDAFAAFEASRPSDENNSTFAIEQRDIEAQLEQLHSYRIPLDEAVRTAYARLAPMPASSARTSRATSHA